MTEKTAPAPAPLTLAELEERVRQRLIHNGQHGALAEFGQYTAAVYERLNGVRGVAPSPVEKAFISTPRASTPVGSAGTAVESVIDTATGRVISTKSVKEPANPNAKPKKAAAKKAKSK